MYLIFFIIIMIEFMFSYNFFKKNLMEPSIILTLYYIMMILFSLYQYNYWELDEFNFETMIFLVLGISFFVIGGMLANRIVLKKNVKIIKAKKSCRNDNKGFIEYKRIDLNLICIVFAVVVACITLLYFYIFWRTSAGNMGGTSNAISSYKSFRNSDDMSMPFILNLMIKCTGMLAQLSLICLINNAICNDLKKKDLICICIPIINVMICVLSSNRGDLLMMLFSAFSAMYILGVRIKGKTKKLNEITIKKGIKILVVAALVFWALIFILSTEQENKYNTNFLSYISSYISGSLASFDVYIKQYKPEVPKWFGQETFVAFNNNISSIFKTDCYSTRFLEFRNTSRYSVVNIYGAVRRFYHDFGVKGILILSFMQGYISSKVYKIVLSKRNKKSIDFSLFFYCYFFYTIVYYAIDDLFYSSNFSISGIEKILLMIITYKFFFYKSSQLTLRKEIE